MATNLVDLAKKHLEALGKQDWKTYRAMLTDRVIYEEEPTQRRIEGADPFVDVVKKWQQAFPDLHANIKQLLASGDAVVAEIEWEGTHRGQLDGPFGPIPPKGAHGKVPAVVVMRFDGDKIRECRQYFDLMTLLRNIGAVPRPAAQPTP